MASEPTVPGFPESGSRQTWLTTGLLLLCLVILFHRSFLPEQVLFSNDASLGLISAQADKRWTGFFGYWQDLNWIGIEQPSATPNVSIGLFLLTGPIAYAKFYAPLGLLFLGVAAWFCFRQIGLHPLACLLGAVAAALNTNTLSNAAWGLPSRALTLAAAFVAVGALANLSRGAVWLRTALAGFAIGLAVAEGYDVGAIFSLYLAAFALVLTLARRGLNGRGLAAGAARVGLMAVCAAFLAAQALSTLIGTQVSGAPATGQELRTEEQQWDWATQWSLPKIETIRVIVPGIFGYRLQNAAGENYSGSYWGRVGQTPGWDEHRMGLARHSGSGEYAGVLVVLVALWGVLQSFRGREGVFSQFERRIIWFWAAAAVVSLLLAYGRHAPFYQFVYVLPFFSTIRNPIKFMHPFHLCVLVLFAYGVHALARAYLSRQAASSGAMVEHLKNWWNRTQGFDKRWALGTMIAVGIAMLFWLGYMSSRGDLAKHLESVGFASAEAAAMARFSAGEVAWFVVFLTASALTLLLMISRWFSGSRARWAGLILMVILVLDMVRASRPWIVYYDYKEKYQSNAILDILREDPVEHRVASRLFPLRGGFLVAPQAQPLFVGIHSEWLQNHFQYFNIQSLDIIQMPRPPALDQNFMTAFQPARETEMQLVGRLWQLSNTRFVLGQTSFLPELNRQLDPAGQRFEVHTAFSFRVRPSVSDTSALRLEDFEVQVSPEGEFALFEFTGALPRAKLYNSWEVNTNDLEVLQRLQSSEFDPFATVLVNQPLPSSGVAPGEADAGKVELLYYEPRRVELRATAEAPSVLLWNDRWDDDWEAWVDGREVALLRCNYIMRGVYLEAGDHEVVLRYRPSRTAFYVSVLAWFVAIGICGMVVARRDRR